MRSKLAFARRHGIAITVLFVALGGTSYAMASVSSSGVINACANKRSGVMRLVKPGAKCRKKERPVS
jgi:hypothetical protein